MIRRPPRSTLSSSSAASDVYKRQPQFRPTNNPQLCYRLAAVSFADLEIYCLCLNREQKSKPFYQDSLKNLGRSVWIVDCTLTKARQFLLRPFVPQSY